MPPKKVDNNDDNEKESFRKFLTSLEEDPDLGSDGEKEEEEEESDDAEDAFLGQQDDDDNDDDDDHDDDDNDSLNEWMREEEEFIEDSEITQLLNASLEKRAKLRQEDSMNWKKTWKNLTITWF
ncbi:unnamed protein product [Rhizopus stolonifer]